MTGIGLALCLAVLIAVMCRSHCMLAVVMWVVMRS
jgi:hypothetical protein